MATSSAARIGPRAKDKGTERRLQLLEVLRGDAGLSEDGTKSSARDGRTWMIRNHRAALRRRVVPDFVTPFGLTVEHEAGFP